MRLPVVVGFLRRGRSTRFKMANAVAKLSRLFVRFAGHGLQELFALNAFLNLYCADLPTQQARQLRSFWLAWNGQGAQAAEPRGFAALQGLTGHAVNWAQQLSEQTDLAANLAAFCNNLVKSRVST